jgi:hypothetical protein
MNGIPLDVLLSPLLIMLAVAMLVGAARHRNASGNVRGITMLAGVAILAFGLINIAISRSANGNDAWVPISVITSAFIGAFIGYWIGHTSRAVR